MNNHSTYLIHYGTKGQKWGNRRYQNEDGSYTSEGKIHYGIGNKKGVYSAKIENYHKGSLFRDPYYVDKRGKKRSYLSYKEMPYEAQGSERRRRNGKNVAKKYGKVALGVAAATAVGIGAAYYMHKNEYHVHFKDLGIRINFEEVKI